MTKKRVFVVTGGNAGIGRAVAQQLAEADHHFVIVSRNREKGERAASEIREATGNDSVDVVQGDLSSMASTNALADRLLEAYPRIHVLINNAGVWMTRRELNEDGLEMTFMVNHVAPFLLSMRLLDRLKESAPARIVNVNAGLYVRGEADLAQLPAGKNFMVFKTYMHSKLCNVLFTVELAKRLDGSGVTVNALHPGVINTKLGISPGLVGTLLKFIKRFWGTPEDGAKPAVYLATSPELEGVSGKYFDLMKETPLAANATQPGLAEDVWRYTEELTSAYVGARQAR